MDNPNKKRYLYTVGILIFHRTPELVSIGKRCLDSVISSIDRDTTQIIIVDNGSPEESSYWKENSDTYIRFNQNRGVSAGWNAILREARGEFINILGDDTIVQKGWLEAMKECFTRPQCGVSNPYVEHLPGGDGIVKDYKWFSGACFMLTPQVVQDVGYFREDLYFPTNFEDTDYWIRCMLKGYRLYKNFDIEVKHLEGQTTKAQDLDDAKKNTRATFMQEWGFDPIPYFCAGESIYKVLHIPE